MKRIILTLIFSLGTMIIVNGQEKQPEQLLSEAIYQEEVNGELDEAIRIYPRPIYHDNKDCICACIRIIKLYQKIVLNSIFLINNRN